jgi:excisionase family DNA binding protein
VRDGTTHQRKTSGQERTTPDRGKMLTLAEAADTLGVHPRTVRRMIARGDLAAVRIGPRLLRVRAADVEALGRPLRTVHARA